MTAIERVRELCKAKGVPYSALEKALGFSNGYLNPKKAKTISYARLTQIAAYFNVPISDLIYGSDLSGTAGTTQKAPTPEGERESSFAEEVTRVLLTLPKDRLRGILLSQGAPADLLSDLDRQE